MVWYACVLESVMILNGMVELMIIPCRYTHWCLPFSTVDAHLFSVSVLFAIPSGNTQFPWRKHNSMIRVNFQQIWDPGKTLTFAHIIFNREWCHSIINHNPVSPTTLKLVIYVCPINKWQDTRKMWGQPSKHGCQIWANLIRNGHWNLAGQV